jgi:hypothetical protein
MQDKSLREWKGFNFINREAKLTIKSREVVPINLVLFEDEEYEVEEMGEKENGNKQQIE